jgi:hypothetical protein
MLYLWEADLKGTLPSEWSAFTNLQVQSGPSVHT